MCVEEKGEIKENAFDSRCSDGWNSLIRELKLVYSTRATSRCKKNKKTKRKGFLLHWFLLI